MNKILSIIIIIIVLTPFTASIYTADEIKNNELPSYFSWQNINGDDYTTPIRDQSPAPTCEAYALCASLETLIKYQTTPRSIYFDCFLHFPVTDPPPVASRSFNSSLILA